MKKKINFRYYFILALSLIIVTILLMNFLNDLRERKSFLITITLISLVLLGFAFLSRKLEIIILSSIVILVNLLSVNVITKEEHIEDNLKFNNVNVNLTGRISTKYSYSSDNVVKVILDDVDIFSDYEYLKLDGKVVLYIERSNLDTLKLNVGTYVEAVTEINFYNLSDFKNISNLSNNVKGYGFCYSYNLQVLNKSHLTLRDKIQNFVYEKLVSYNLEFADIGFAMIFGNVDYIDKDIKTAFQDSGIAHLLAVSGFNISIIVSVIAFILKKINISNLIKFLINVIIIVAYMYLCDFSPSVVRAALMTIISMYAKIRGKPYDILSSLSFVASLMILVNPLNLYNYSFILSFSALLIIILLSPKIKNFLNKYFYNSFSDSFSLCLSVQVGLLLTQLCLFSKIPLFSIITNLIAVPVSVLSFITLLIVYPLSLIFPFLSILLVIFDKLTLIIVQFSNFISGIDISINLLGVRFLHTLLYFLIIFCVSDYLFESKRNKLFIVLNIILLCLII